jgi:hypothetical protein
MKSIESVHDLTAKQEKINLPVKMFEFRLPASTRRQSEAGQIINFSSTMHRIISSRPMIYAQNLNIFPGY